MKKILFLSSVVVIASFFVQAGDDEEVVYHKPKEKIKVAKDLYERGSYYNAIEFFKDYLNDIPKDIEAMYLCAEAHRHLRDYYGAESWYRKVVDLNSSKYPDARFWYASMLKTNLNYDLAIREFDKFIKEEGKKAGRNYVEWAKNGKKGAEMALDMIADEGVKVKRLDNTINSLYSDHGPFAVTSDKLIWSAVRSDTPIVVTDTVNYDTKLSRIYQSERKDGKWGEAEVLPDIINDAELHTANGSFSPDRDVFFFTKCDLDENLKIRCDIYVSRYKGGQWSSPRKLPASINNPQSNNTHPAVVTNGDDRYLYYASDRDGEGGMDIWYAGFDQTLSFSTPRNAGKTINTSRDEMTPFFDDSRELLYFSSNGHPGIGGYDIFRVSREGSNSWSEPMNMKTPINSGADDLYFSLAPDRTAYIASNRPGTFSLKSETCCDDIYALEIKNKVSYEGFAYELGDPGQTPLPDVMIKVYTRKKGGRKYVLSKEVSVDPTTNRYSLELSAQADYKLVATKAKYLTDVKYLKGVDIEKAKDNVEILFGLDKISKDKTYALNNIYYDYNRADLRPESEGVLDTLYALLEDNPSIVIELSSHTDSRGGEAFNNRLSQARAESCVRYLIENGIHEDRLVPMGYGETMLKNDCEDGVKCSEEEHQVNRRTEFRIIGTLEEGYDIPEDKRFEDMEDYTEEYTTEDQEEVVEEVREEPAEAPAPTETSSSDKIPIKYKVQPGNTLYSLARQFNTSVDNVKNWNNLKSNALFVGQELIVGWE